MSAARLINSLSGVKQTGNSRWLAKCPAHDDGSPSLSIRELEDGRVLIHDFGGCGTHDVLGALGLSLSDLFPERIGEFQPTRARIPAGDILQAVAHELDVAALLLVQVVERRDITEFDWQRIARCARIVGCAAHV
jgi:hypothetical protein